MATTNINLANNKIDQISDLELFKQLEKLKEEKVKLNIEKANTINAVNIIYEFPYKRILINNLCSKK